MLDTNPRIDVLINNGAPWLEGRLDELSDPEITFTVTAAVSGAILVRMNQSIVHVALLVREYDEAIEFYTKKLNFSLVEDTYIPDQDKRWVLIAPPGSRGTNLLLARPSTPRQGRFVGNQTGGRVSFFLNTDDFWRDYRAMVAKGVQFVRKPKEASYGTVAVFRDLYGNLWDLLEMKGAPSAAV